MHALLPQPLSSRRGTAVAALMLAMLSMLVPAQTMAARVSVMLGLPDSLEQQARARIATVFNNGGQQVSVYLPSQFGQLPAVSTDADDVVVAAGRQACEFAAQNVLQQHVLCVLLSAHTFDRIKTDRVRDNTRHRFAAIVIDQPLERQVRIASKVFPSLKKFGVLASNRSLELANTSSGKINDSTLKIDHYSESHAVSAQVANALSGQDALVAIPDKNVYASDQLRTVLLTAYGYAKPVIGYSRSYVRAGALITAFTTLDQVFRQTAEILDTFASDDAAAATQTYYPQYFSIEDNPSIAKSLGLVQRFHYRKQHDYVDGDFTS